MIANNNSYNNAFHTYLSGVFIPFSSRHEGAAIVNRMLLIPLINMFICSLSPLVGGGWQHHIQQHSSAGISIAAITLGIVDFSMQRDLFWSGSATALWHPPWQTPIADCRSSHWHYQYIITPSHPPDTESGCRQFAAAFSVIMYGSRSVPARRPRFPRDGHGLLAWEISDVVWQAIDATYYHASAAPHPLPYA